MTLKRGRDENTKFKETKKNDANEYITGRTNVVND